MTVGDDDAVYTLQGIQEMLGISRNVVVGLIRAGFVSPARGPRNTYRFGFQDVVLLRTAQALRSADIPARRIHRSLERLRALLPSSVPMTGLRITAVGDDIAVRTDGQDVALESGQLLMDFDVARGPGDVLSFPARGGVDKADAESIDADSYLTLGAVLHESGSLEEALEVYEHGLVAFPDNAELHYNRAIVLEDVGRIDDALVAYERCLAIAADFADAHWNVARLYDERGGAQQALRHWSAYRRLQR